MMDNDNIYIRFAPDSEWISWNVETPPVFLTVLNITMQNALTKAYDDRIKIVNHFGQDYYVLEGSWLRTWKILSAGVFTFHSIYLPGEVLYDADHPGIQLSNWESEPPENNNE